MTTKPNRPRGEIRTEESWLQRQIRLAQESIAECPEWMQELMYFEGSDKTDYYEFTGV